MMHFITNAIRRARVTVLAGVVCGIVLISAKAAAQELEVDQFEIFLRPGAGHLSNTFTVRNLSSRAQTAQLKIADWYRAEDGANVFVDAGTTRGSCSSQIQIFPATLRLAAGASQAVSVTYKGDPQLKTSCWSAVHVEAAPLPQTDARGVQLLVTVRMSVKIYVEPTNARPALELAELDIVKHVPEPSKPASDTLGNDVIARVRNPGTIQSRVKGHVEYKTIDDKVVQRVPLVDFPVLPGATRTVRSKLPALPVGRYFVLVFFDYGGAELLAGQIELDLSK